MTTKSKFKKAAIPFLLIASGGFLLSLISASPSKAQAACDWFTGEYRDLGRGVIVHYGQG
ncbi:MAG: hypothetical protein GDA48_16665 [Hormoscilla sp. GM102CHS1]|nr:hypothetical protein [Hormoscilla sp. GM102CHS1]